MKRIVRAPRLEGRPKVQCKGSLRSKALSAEVKKKKRKASRPHPPFFSSILRDDIKHPTVSRSNQATNKQKKKRRKLVDSRQTDTAKRTTASPRSLFFKFDFFSNFLLLSCVKDGRPRVLDSCHVDDRITTLFLLR